MLTQQFLHVHGQQCSGVQCHWSGRTFTSDLIRKGVIKGRKEGGRERGREGMKGKKNVNLRGEGGKGDDGSQD